jgi:hypothetical protein
MDIGTLTGQIQIEDHASRVLDFIGDQIKKFGETFTKHAEEAAKSGELIGASFSGVAGTIIADAAAVTAAIAAVTGVIIALGNRGSDVNDVANTFDHFTGTAERAAATMEALRKGTLGTVDDFDLMKSSTKLLAAGVNLTADQFGTLSSAAFVLQNQGLGPTKDMLDLVSQALLTGRTRTLEMKIGKIDLAKAEREYAASIGVEKLSRMQKVEADRIGILDALNKKVKEAGEQHRDFGEQMEHAIVVIKNWGDELASRVASSSHVTEAVSAVGTALQKAFGGDSQTLLEFIVKWIDRFADAWKKWAPIIIDYAAKIRDWVEKILDSVHKAWDDVPDWFKNIAKEATIAGVAVAGVHVATKQLTGQDVLSNVAAFSNIWSAFGSGAKEKIGLIVAAMKELFALGGLRYVFVGAIGAIGSALSAMVVPALVTASLAAAAEGVWQVIGAIQALRAEMKNGGNPFEFFMKKDDDTWARRWLGWTDRPTAPPPIPTSSVFDPKNDRIPTGAIDIHTGKPVLSGPIDLHSPNVTDVLTPSGVNIPQSGVVPGMSAKDVIMDPEANEQMEKALKKIRDAMIPITDRQKVMVALWHDANKELDSSTMADAMGANADAVGKFVNQLDKAKGASDAQKSISDKLKAGMDELMKGYVKDAEAKGDAQNKVFKQTEDLREKNYQSGLTDSQRQMRMIDLQYTHDIAAAKTMALQTGTSVDDLTDQIEIDYSTAWFEAADAAQQAQDKITIDAQNAAKKTTLVWEDKLSVLAGVFTQIAQVAGDSFGGIVKDAANVVVSWDAATQAMKNFKQESPSQKAVSLASGVAAVIQATGSGSTGARVLGGALSGAAIGTAILPGIGTAVGAVAGAVTGLIRGIAGLTAYQKAVRAAAVETKNLQDQLVNSHGSMQQLTADAALVGIDIKEAFSWKDPEAFKKVIEDLDKKTQALTADMQTYGFTWKDMGEKAQSGGTQAGNALVDSFKRMTLAGIPAAKVLASMSDNLNQYILDSIHAGTKIPAAMQPIIEQLIKAGDLSDAAARAMLGLADDTMPSLADITGAAEKYGITLDELGPKVKQLQITDLANEYVKDWKILSAATDDWGVLFDKMGPKVQDLVSDAIRYGSVLPSSMKPMLEAFVNAGKLTDDTGEKLTDLSKLHFAADLSEMFEGLMAKLDDLIDKITDGVGGALTNLGNMTVNPHINPTVGGGEPDDSNPENPGNPQYHAMGGTVAWTPRGTDTVPAMLTPGETVIPAGRREEYVATVRIPVNLDGEKIAEAVVRVARRQ